MKPVTLIRTCNWDRQSGKTSFVVSDAIRVIQEDSTAKVIIFEPDAAHTESAKELLEKRLKALNSDIDFMERIHIFSFPVYFKIYKLGRFNGIHAPKYTNFYLDDVNYYPGSFEEIMHCLQSIKDLTCHSKITFMATKVNKLDTLSRAENLIRNDKEWEIECSK